MIMRNGIGYKKYLFIYLYFEFVHVHCVATMYQIRNISFKLQLNIIWIQNK